ncbi:unnamed protein product [Amoebophrya sp. A25]|nr:unnamed protein product [Amoebophrya sp. A25]|eukprot:GSA25T00022657001.1
MVARRGNSSGRLTIAQQAILMQEAWARKMENVGSGTALHSIADQLVIARWAAANLYRRKVLVINPRTRVPGVVPAELLLSSKEAKKNAAVSSPARGGVSSSSAAPEKNLPLKKSRKRTASAAFSDSVAEDSSSVTVPESTRSKMKAPQGVITIDVTEKASANAFPDDENLKNRHSRHSFLSQQSLSRSMTKTTSGASKPPANTVERVLSVVTDILFFPEQRLAHLGTAKERREADITANRMRMMDLLWSARESLDIAMHQIEDDEIAQLLIHLVRHRPWVKIRIIIDKAMHKMGAGNKGKSRSQVDALKDALQVLQKKFVNMRDRGQAAMLKSRVADESLAAVGFPLDALETAPAYRQLQHRNQEEIDADLARFRQTLAGNKKLNIEIRRSNVRNEDATGKMHHKFVVIDGKVLLTGSYNWTLGAADRNHESAIVLKSNKAVAAYEEEFNLLWKEYEGLKRTEGRLSTSLVLHS